MLWNKIHIYDVVECRRLCSSDILLPPLATRCCWHLGAHCCIITIRVVSKGASSKITKYEVGEI